MKEIVWMIIKMLRGFLELCDRKSQLFPARVEIRPTDYKTGEAPDVVPRGAQKLCQCRLLQSALRLLWEWLNPC